MTQVRHKVFGKDSLPTIYYFTGYQSVIKQYKPHIYSLTTSGYRVVAFDYDRSILTSGDPIELITVVKEIEKIVRKDMNNREVAGAYGISLGTWISGAVMTELDIEYGVYNSCGCSLANVVWTKALFEDAKKNFQQHNYSQEDLEEYWAPYDVRLIGEKFADKTLLVMNGTDDELIDIRETRETVKKWRANGNKVAFIEVPKLKHSRSIMRNMLRVKMVTKFFTDNDNQT